MDFKECTYINNHAEFGNIIYAHSKDVLPVIGPLKSSDISTIPAYFEINEDKIVSILSGEKIPEDIMCESNIIIIIIIIIILIIILIITMI